MTLAISRCHYPVRGLGFGARTGIWFQGCSIHCPGCIVPESWQARPEHSVLLPALLASLQPWLEQSDGVTISGGEPFEQPEALHGLLAGLRMLSHGDLLVYSGLSWTTLCDKYPHILRLCDAVVSEPYLSRKAAPSPLRGSTNQIVHKLTAKARTRYRNWKKFAPAASVAQDGDVLRMAGIIPRSAVVNVAKAIARTGRTARLTHGSL